MAHVPLPFRGVAVLLLVASTALGQSPEPPAEFSLDPVDTSSPNLLRQFSNEIHNPLLNLMVDGEFTSVDAAPAQKESAKIKPTPQQSKEKEGEAIEVDGCPAEEMGCPTIPNCLPFACMAPPPPQCHCRKCERQRKHGHGNQGGCNQGYGYGYGGGYGNGYLNWPTCPAWCFYGAPLVPCQGGCCHRGHCWSHRGHGGCGNQGCGCQSGGGYGGWQGWNGMCGDGFMNQGCGGCMPYVAPPPPLQQGHCRKHQRHQGCSNNYGYGCGYGYSGGWGMGCGGFMEGCCMPCMVPPPPPQQCHCHRCQRHHGCSRNFGTSANYGYGSGCCYGYAGYGCPGWSVNECNQGCGKHQRNRRHHGNSCQQQQPYACFGCAPMMSYAGGDSLMMMSYAGGDSLMMMSYAGGDMPSYDGPIFGD